MNVGRKVTLRLGAAVLLAALSLVGLDVVDSARTVVVVAGYLWFAGFSSAAVLLIVASYRALPNGQRTP